MIEIITVWTLAVNIVSGGSLTSLNMGTYPDMETCFAMREVVMDLNRPKLNIQSVCIPEDVTISE